MTTEMMFDVAKYRKLRKAHREASRLGLDVFTFDGVELHTGYAKYVLEFLAKHLGVEDEHHPR